MSSSRKYTTHRIVQGAYWDVAYGHPYLYGAGSPRYTEDYSANSVDEILISQGHPYQRLGKNDNEDIGGDFFVIKHHYGEDSTLPEVDVGTEQGTTSGYGDHYRGPLYARRLTVSAGDSLYPSPPVSTPAELAVLGTTAIARVIPTNPLSGLSVAIGELRQEGIPAVIGAQSLQKKVGLGRKAGSEYLNYAFGWLPLVNDLRDFAQTVTNSDELVAQYVRNSGKRVKRRYSFPKEETVTTEQVDDGFTALPVPRFHIGFYESGIQYPIVTRTRHTIVEKWFSGCFTYYLPPHEGLERSAAIANKLYGTRITPEVLYDLTPWSWAVDWFSNVGDVIHNVGAFLSDGLIMPYGYMMEKSSTSDTYVASGTSYKSYPGQEISRSQTFTTTVKQRIKATPYGFGLTDTDLTQRQWAIIAALGLSHGGGRAGH